MPGFGIGMLRAAVVQRHGLGQSLGAYTGAATYRVKGGIVTVGFSSRRPGSGRVTSLACGPGSADGPAGSSCPAGFRLPDGVRIGMAIPFRTPWRGYRRYQPADGQADFFYYRKSVHAAGRRLQINLMSERGHIVYIAETT